MQLLTLASSISGFLFDKNVWQNVWANVLFIGVGYIIVILFKQRNMIEFFGFNKQKRLSILLSTLLIRGNTALTYSGSVMSYSGLAIPEYEYQVIPFFSNLFSIITTGDNVFKTMLNRIFLGDVDIEYVNTPLNMSQIRFNNFICVGGPSANIVTDYYLKNGQSWLGFNASSGVEIQKGKSKGRLLGISNAQDDYGILEKIIDDKNNSCVFIAAGGNIGATKGASYYLATKWKELRNEFKGKGFAICFKVPQYFNDPNGYKYPQIIYKK